MKKIVRANGKMTQKYAKMKKWPKITFRGSILVPEVAFWGFWGLVLDFKTYMPKITFRGSILVNEVAFWGFWGLVCIEKWS